MMGDESMERRSPRSPARTGHVLTFSHLPAASSYSAGGSRRVDERFLRAPLGHVDLDPPASLEELAQAQKLAPVAPSDDHLALDSFFPWTVDLLPNPQRLDESLPKRDNALGFLHDAPLND